MHEYVYFNVLLVYHGAYSYVFCKIHQKYTRNTPEYAMTYVFGCAPDGIHQDYAKIHTKYVKIRSFSKYTQNTLKYVFDNNPPQNR